ncbi:hypothetical protein APHDU1_0518 [Anaplasma phagocytophilum]|nr:hypothetical protein APHHGE2_1537 [Anaplasma phagocytophilum str. HGE2]KJV87254.1 hypothetical protein APHNYW_1253 [Anaplasma phagocytophilum str. ApNYW]KJZ99828.1 hypothetical protein APHDU1_0518 [Anaplasma phagocytophilum]
MLQYRAEQICSQSGCECFHSIIKKDMLSYVVAWGSSIYSTHGK